MTTLDDIEALPAAFYATPVTHPEDEDGPETGGFLLLHRIAGGGFRAWNQASNIQHSDLFALRMQGSDPDALLDQQAADILFSPALARVYYGKLTGDCCWCGEPMTDPESQENGLHAECFRKFKI